MKIEHDFEGGRIEVLSVAPLGQDVVLAIPPDTKNAAYRQWFCFDALGTIGVEERFVIDNASACTFVNGFAAPYQVYASADHDRWVRVPSRFDGTRLSFSYVPPTSRTRYAYYPPFSSNRVESLLASIHGVVSVEILATVAPGADVLLLTAGNQAADRPRIWFVGQQHPGEHMGGWYLQGLLHRLATPDATALREQCLWCVVPQVNPSGVRAGNHRTNTYGVDLNRAWASPTEREPEIAAIQAAMHRNGVDLFVDVHGDERIPYLFGQPADDHPQRSPYAATAGNQLVELFCAKATGFQMEHRYPVGRPARPNLKLAGNWVEHTFDCPVLTIEMPFSNTENHPDQDGFSPDRAARFGSETVDVIAAMLAQLRKRPG